MTTFHTVLDSAGCRLAATVGIPAGQPPFPAIVFTGPLTGVRDQVVAGYAERLGELGFVTLTLDHRNFGESGGQPRQHEDPQGKLRDLRTAVAALIELPEVAADRIALFGISLGGGYALQAAVTDPRVAAVVCVAGAFNSPLRTFRKLGPRAYRQVLERFLPAESGPDGEAAYLPVVAAGDGPAMIAGAEQYAYFASHRGRSSHWENRITAASAYNLILFDALSAADLLGELPLLLVHGRRDDYCSPDVAREVYQRAAGPKKLVWLDTDCHVDLYDRSDLVSRAVEETAAFLDRHLPTTRG